MFQTKFRGKTFEGKWAFGYLMHGSFDWMIMTKDSNYVIDEDTVGQFTNHYDKYGNEIYGGLDNNGGDIVKTISNDVFAMDEIVNIKEIAWAQKGGWHAIRTYCDNLAEFLSDIHGKNISEVVGNKFENSELLK